MSELKNFKILVVDDDEDLREIMSSIFETEGFTVLSADSGNSAFAILEQNPADLIVSDMRMANGDGMSLLERIRKKHPTIPVLIFVTGFTDVSVEECVKKGAKSVFQKPFNQQELVKSVKSSLGIPV